MSREDLFSKVPGPDKFDKKEGNLLDIGKAGSLHQYLVHLHKTFGEIVRFRWGTHDVISIASPRLFKEQAKLFDRPKLLFAAFEPLIGPESLQYANQDDGKFRRSNYDRFFNHQHMQFYQDTVIQSGNDKIMSIWKEASRKGTTVSVDQTVAVCTLRSVLECLMGKDAIANDEMFLEFKANYDIVWSEMEYRMFHGPPQNNNDPRVNLFNKSLNWIKDFVRNIVRIRQNLSFEEMDQMLFIDKLIEISPNEDVLLADTISYIVGGFHTTGNGVIWACYFLANDATCQSRLQEELDNISIDSLALDPPPYLSAVIKETLRCATVAPWAARELLEDATLGGYSLPAGTPVIHAIGVLLEEAEVFPNPSQFHPDRFLGHEKIPPYTFEPFGFAGKRKCPGYRLSNMEMAIWIAQIFKEFTVNLDEFSKNVDKVFGLVTHPSKEIKVNLIPQNSDH